jgi:hypothetical protein
MASAHAWRKLDNYLLKGDRSPILPDRAFLWGNCFNAKTQRGKDAEDLGSVFQMDWKKK